ncbi:unnamed protein product [Lathyrus oleraceus]
MYVLVNESPTEYFKVLRGLRQGYPLSPFLFSIVVEGLAAVVRRAANLDVLHGFKLMIVCLIVFCNLLMTEF